MPHAKDLAPRVKDLLIGSLLLVCLFSLRSTPAFSKGRSKPETIDATATGSGAQAGRQFSITLIIYEYSTAADEQILSEAFQNGQNQGLFNALSKMKAVGHIAVTGTLGYDVGYIRATRTPTGRKIVFVTNRLLRLGEIYRDTLSSSYNLTAGEIDLNAENKSKSTGVFYPEAALALNKQGQLQFNLVGFTWQLGGIIDFKGTPGVN